MATTLRKHAPLRKISGRYSAKPSSGMPDFEMLKPSGNATGVVVAIAEGRASDESIEDLPEPRTPDEDDTQTLRPRTLPPALTIPPKAHVRHEPKVVSAEHSPVSSSPPPSREQDAANVPLPQSSVDTPNLDLKNGEKGGEKDDQMSEPEQTPVMRSMFPSYNPNIPLTRQEYAPNLTIVPPSNYTRRFSSNNPYTQQKNRSQTSLGAPSVPKEPKESPLRPSESLKGANAISTPEELLGMWNMANGQDFEHAAASYVLELACEDLSLNHEVITFSSSTHPVFTLTASPEPASSVTVKRTHPEQTAAEIAVCSSELSMPSRQDPLVCTIFPKLAGLMALDQSSTIALDHDMTREESAQLQSEAITSAQDREASLLLWDADSDRFCIMHPTLLDNAATSLPIKITPNTSAPTLIVISAPETNKPLLTLDIHALTLKIHTQAITALPSLYVLDSLVTSLLILLLHLHRSCAIPRARRHVARQQQQVDPFPESNPLFFPPPPPSLHSQRSRSQIRQAKRSRSHSLFRSTNNRSAYSVAASTTHSALASPTPWSPTPNTRYSATIASTIGGDHGRDIELCDLSPNGTSMGNTKQKPPKPLFGADDESLPAGTRAVLKFLYWVFEVVYWILGVFVQVLSAAVVAGGKLVTKL